METIAIFMRNPSFWTMLTVSGLAPDHFTVIATPAVDALSVAMRAARSESSTAMSGRERRANLNCKWARTSDGAAINPGARTAPRVRKVAAAFTDRRQRHGAHSSLVSGKTDATDA
ncbi:hypothetical protein MTP99_000495 [Tenebrio molitor]|nr:hypothetical protein MTP99_000495 [Tenebrio molitor]